MEACTALLLIDVIGAFCHPQGSMFCAQAPATLRAIGRLLATARTGGLLIVHTREQHLPGEPNWEQARIPPHCLVDTPETAWAPGVEPLPGELVLPKRRYSAFFGTDLAIRLYEHDVKRLIITGLKTNVCVRATVQDAFACSREAVTSNRLHLHEASLEDIDRYFGHVVGLDEALAMMGTLAPGVER